MTAQYNVFVSDGTIRVRAAGNAAESLKRACPMALSRKSKEYGKHWSCPVADAPKIVAWADQNHLTVDPKLREWAQGLWTRELSAMATATASSVPPEDRVTVEGLTSTLLDSQHVVTLAASRAWVDYPGKRTRHRALLVADEPGFGKTIMSLAAARTAGLEAKRLVVVCPTSLTKNWEAEMIQHFDMGLFQSWTARSTTPTPVPESVDSVVIGWDVLHAWVDTLVKWAPDALIVDEGHYAKTGRRVVRTKTVTQPVKRDGVFQRDERGNLLQEEVTTETVSGTVRASAVLTLSAAVARKGGLVMALTGTPIVNRPAELAPLLDLVGAIDLFGGSEAFKERFCGPKMVPGGPRGRVKQYKGATNLLELNTRLASSGLYVRRTKGLLIREGLLKPKYVDGVDAYDYTATPNPWMLEPTFNEMIEYRNVEMELGDFFADRAQSIAVELYKDVSHPDVQKKVRAEGARHLQRIAALRQAAAQVKAPYIIEKVRQMNARGERVVIAAHHREIVDLYADAFSGLKIQGHMGVAAIEKAKAAFNTGRVEDHPVLVLSVEAGKTGHTLCKQAENGVGPSCAFMVFAEQIWTPGDEAQAQDRIWRIGQEREVRIINALLRDSIDVDMYRQRQEKRRIINEAVDAVQADSGKSERDGAGRIAWQLAQARLSR